ncbi:unnamed protein product [Lactuca virosa]|uniref:Uncharacterized protein n=1 Tax=Lactuca virosa TaxID=75947 RepID=A0AAU9ML39_9ASTR|nr:unnamed protein product [Lactuca virosa]
MPLTSVVADALGVVTISLVTLLGLIGLLCILYSFYFRDHIRTQTHTQLGYFSGPWIIRIIFIFFSIFWGFSEILRLEFLRREEHEFWPVEPEVEHQNDGLRSPRFPTVVCASNDGCFHRTSIRNGFAFERESFFPLRVLLLGLSVLFKPGDAVFEVLAFLAFLSLLCCSGVGICVLVYFPIADSLALKNLQDIREHDTRSLLANHGPPDDFTTGSTKRGSISFRAIEREENLGGFVELSLFSPSQHLTPMGSPQVHGWPMLPLGSSL